MIHFSDRTRVRKVEISDESNDGFRTRAAVPGESRLGIGGDEVASIFDCAKTFFAIVDKRLFFRFRIHEMSLWP